MNKLTKIVVTSILMVSVSSEVIIPSITLLNVNAAKVVKKMKPNSEYPNINTKFDVTNMSQYSDDDLFSTVQMNNYYVKDMGTDGMKQVHLLLTPNKKSNQYFLLVTKSKKKIRLHNKISIQGIVNGSSRINTSQINAGINSNYKDKKIVLVDADRISIKK